MQTFASPAARIAKFKGEILRHAIPVEVLSITGTHRKIPKNRSDTVVYRRWLPAFGGATTDSTTINNWEVDPVNFEVEEGVTPDVNTLQPQDITVVLREYGVLFMYTDKVADLYEDDVPSEMIEQTGESMGLVREMVRYGALKGCTNKFYAGGTTRATVDEPISVPLLRQVTRSISGNRGKMINKVMTPSPNYNTSPTEPGYLVFCHTHCESDIRELPGFFPCAEYSQRSMVHEMEVGSVDRYRFVVSPELKGFNNAGAAVGTTGLFSTGGSNVDVFPMIVVAENAWADVTLRGLNSFSPTHIPASKKDKSDPLAQRGYVGSKFWDAAFIQNDGWMAVVEVGVTNLTP